jgi:hypothetical protein
MVKVCYLQCRSQNTICNICFQLYHKELDITQHKSEMRVTVSKGTLGELSVDEVRRAAVRCKQHIERCQREIDELQQQRLMQLLLG